MVIINNDNFILKKHKYPKNIHLIRCGSDKDSDIVLEKYSINTSNLTSNISIKTKQGKIIFTSKILGKHFAESMCLVAGCALYLNIPIANLKTVFSNFKTYQNRGGIIEKKNITIFNYSYNANPTSMQANLNIFKDIKGKNKIIILGDMLELNTKKEYFYHKDIYKRCLSITSNICIFTDIFKKVVQNENFPFLINGNTIETVVSKIINFIDPKKKYFIFVQGSNDTKISKIIDQIMFKN